MPIEIETLSPDSLEMTVTGTLDKSDYQDAVAVFEEHMKVRGTVNLLIRVHDFHGWHVPALWEDLKFDIAHYRDVPRLAVVGDDESKKWIATACKPFTGAKVMFFPQREIEAARAWVRGVSATEPARPGL